jgi:hypothetical protein
MNSQQVMLLRYTYPKPAHNLTQLEIFEGALVSIKQKWRFLSELTGIFTATP